MQHIHRTTSTIFLKIFKKIISKQSNWWSGGKLKYSFRRLWLGSFKWKFQHIWLYLFNSKVRSILTICWFYILNFIRSSHHGLQRLPIGNDFGILFKTRLLHLAQMKNIPFVTYEFITRTKKLQQRSIFFPLLKAYRARRFLRRPTVKRHNFSSKISLIIVAGSHGWPLVVETVAGAILMSSFLPVWVTRSFLKFLKHFFFFRVAMNGHSARPISWSHCGHSFQWKVAATVANWLKECGRLNFSSWFTLHLGSV